MQRRGFFAAVVGGLAGCLGVRSAGEPIAKAMSCRIKVNSKADLTGALKALIDSLNAAQEKVVRQELDRIINETKDRHALYT